MQENIRQESFSPQEKKYQQSGTNNKQHAPLDTPDKQNKPDNVQSTTTGGK
jgi:hypothetical protein